MTETLLETRELHVQFRSKRGLGAVLGKGPRYVNAVDGVGLSMYRGEILGLVGESGSGKTTFAKTVLRLVDPTAGVLRFDGRDLGALSDHELRPFRQELQMVFSGPAVVSEPQAGHRRGSGHAITGARGLS